MPGPFVRSIFQRERDFRKISPTNEAIGKELNEVLDEIIESLNSFSALMRHVEASEGGSLTIVNTLDQTINPGQLLGYNSSGVLALANGDSSLITRAIMMSDAAVVPNAEVSPVFSGIRRISLETGIFTPTPGHLAYLSVANSGAATDERPTGAGNKRQIIGIWAKATESDEDFDIVTAPALMLFDQQFSSIS
jgi:hypothetical protein